MVIRVGFTIAVALHVVVALAASGGQTYIVGLFGCDYKTLRYGLEELQDPPDLPPGRIRQKGGTQVLS